VPDPEVTRVEVAGRKLRLTSLDKLLYPATETTKGEVLNYYAQVSEVLLPHLADRAVTRVRWPHGVEGPSFFEKNLPSGAPSWLESVVVDGVRFPLVDNLADLTYLVNLNSIELHVHQWTVADDEPQPPNRMVVDLDPGQGAGLHECARVALMVRDRLSGLGLVTYPVTSGSKGMQLYAGLPGDLDSETVKEMAMQLAQELTKRHPDLVVWKMTKSLRPGKVFLDWSQNTFHKTTVCPYSLRGKEIPTVAAPRTWDEVEAGAEGAKFEQLGFEEVLERVERDGDLLAPLFETEGH